MDSGSNNNENLTYIFGEKENLVIVILCGVINARAEAVLDECIEELNTKAQSCVIISFREVSSIVPGGYPGLAKLQKSIRDSKRFLGLASLKPEAKTALLFSGIVRESEIYESIPEAWQRIVQRLAARGIKLDGNGSIEKKTS